MEKTVEMCWGGEFVPVPHGQLVFSDGTPCPCEASVFTPRITVVVEPLRRPDRNRPIDRPRD